MANVVAVTGDIHAFFAGLARHPDDEQKAVLEFVAGAISSATYFDLLKATALSVSPLAASLADNADALLTAANPHLAQLELKQNGYGVFMASGEALDVKYYAIDAQKITQEKLSGKIADAFAETAFKVAAGKKELLRTNKGKSERWDPDAGKWVAPQGVSRPQRPRPGHSALQSPSRARTGDHRAASRARQRANAVGVCSRSAPGARRSVRTRATTSKSRPSSARAPTRPFSTASVPIAWKRRRVGSIIDQPRTERSGTRTPGRWARLPATGASPQTTWSRA